MDANTKTLTALAPHKSDATATIPEMRAYRCCDDGGDSVDIEANSAASAAEEYFSTAASFGSWEGDSETRWVRVRVWVLDAGGHPDDEYTSHLLAVEPAEPECADERGHDWEREGAVGHGGGVIATERCPRCGLCRYIDSWHQEHSTGLLVPGDHVSYERPDDVEWDDDDMADVE